MTVELDPNRFEDFYNDNGQFTYRQMFQEVQNYGQRKHDNLPKPIYTLKQKHKPELGLISAYQLYMESADEYEAALKICPSLVEWERMAKAKWFLEGASPAPGGFEGLKVWREHMRMRDASLAKKQLLEQTNEGNVTAAKALLAETKVRKPAGRPNKKQDTDKAQLAIVKDFESKRASRK
jgi:hypothetical protein